MANRFADCNLNGVTLLARELVQGIQTVGFGALRSHATSPTTGALAHAIQIGSGRENEQMSDSCRHAVQKLGRKIFRPSSVHMELVSRSLRRPRASHAALALNGFTLSRSAGFNPDFIGKQ